MRILGIDPGLHGAVALIEPAVLYFDGKTPLKEVRVELFDTPIDKEEEGNYYAPERMYDLIASLMPIDKVTIEEPFVMPRSSVAVGKIIGIGFGLWQGILASLKLWSITTEVMPSRWKKDLKLTRDKKGSLKIARDIYPQSKEYIKLLKHEGRAEALLIAHWGLHEEDGQFI